ncbi:MAG: hypothetical protein NVS3B26_10200 [Mycobacteriales bacterium]
MVRKRALLALALVVALLGTLAIFAYVKNIDNRAIANAQPVQVLVAKQAIPAGTTGKQASEQGLLALLTVPRKAAPTGVLSDISPVAGQVTLSDIFVGEMLLRAKFGAQQTTGALPIPPNKIAVAVQLGDPQRVAGFVQPGSDVAVFVTFQTGQQATAGSPSAGKGLVGAGTMATRLLLARVPVIAVGPTTLRTEASTKAGANGKTNTEATPTAILTLAVDQVDAEKLVHAAQTAQLYFGLLSANSVVKPSSGVDNSTLFG